MTSHDFCLWLKGYLAASTSLGADELGFIEGMLDDVCDDAPDPYRPTYIPMTPTPNTSPYGPAMVPYPYCPPSITC